MKKRLIFICFVLLLGSTIIRLDGFGLTSYADTPPEKPTNPSGASEYLAYDYPKNGIVIGQGFNLFDHSGTSETCVVGKTVTLEQTSYSTEVKQAMSSLDVEKSISGSASASFGSFASGSVSMARSSKINSDSQNFIFSFVSNNGSTFLSGSGMVPDEPEVTNDDIKNLKSLTDKPSSQYLEAILDRRIPRVSGGNISLTNEAKRYDQNNFVKHCGHGYVAAILRGVKVDVLLTNNYKNQEEKRAMSAKVKASGFGASGSASYSRSSKKKKINSDLSYRVFQKGGLPMPIVALGYNENGEPEENIDLSKVFPKPSTFIANPTAFTVIIAPYSKLDMPEKIKLPYGPSNLFGFRDYYIVLSDLYDLVGEVIQTEVSGQNSVDDAAFDPILIEAYGGVERLIALRNELHWDLEFLEIMIGLCRQADKYCETTENLKKVKKEYSSLISITANEAYKANQAARTLISDKKTKDTKDVSIQAFTEIKSIDKTAADKFINLGIKEKVKSVKKLSDSLYLDGVDDIIDPELRRTILDARNLANQAAAYERINNYIDQSKGTLSADFYDNFYFYLVNIPIPKSLYSATSFDALANKSKTVYHDQKEKAVAAWLPKANDQLRRVIYSQRISPWRDYFCQELKSAPLCYPDSTLFDIVSAGVPQFTGEDKRIAGRSRPKPPPPREPWDDRGPICERMGRC